MADRDLSSRSPGREPTWPSAKVAVPDAVLLDAIAAAVTATDTEGRILYFNGAAARLYGYARDQMIGANIISLFVEPADQRPAPRVNGRGPGGQQWMGSSGGFGAATVAPWPRGSLTRRSVARGHGSRPVIEPAKGNVDGRAWMHRGRGVSDAVAALPGQQPQGPRTSPPQW